MKHIKLFESNISIDNATIQKVLIGLFDNLYKKYDAELYEGYTIDIALDKDKLLVTASNEDGDSTWLGEIKLNELNI